MNPYSSTDAAPPPWTPSPVTWYQVALGIVAGIVAYNLLGAVLSISGITDKTFDPNDMLTSHAVAAVIAFASTVIAAAVGSRRVCLPLLLIYSLSVFYIVRVLHAIALKLSAADTILATILPSFAMHYVAILTGSVLGHLVFTYRHRPRVGSAPLS